MAISLSKTDICNGALSLVGESSITDLDTDPAEEGVQCRIHYLRTRQKCFERLDWRFLQDTVQLTADLTATNARYGSSFLVPSDFVRIVSTDLDLINVFYFLEADRIVVDGVHDAILLTYIAEQENVGRYSPHFVEYFEYALAERLVYALTKDRLFAREMREMSERKFAEAANIDAMNERNSIYDIDDLIFVRNQRG
jgi:hypothetical protein